MPTQHTSMASNRQKIKENTIFMSMDCSWIQQAVQKVDLFGNLRIYQFANSMQDEHQSSDCFDMP